MRLADRNARFRGKNEERQKPKTKLTSRWSQPTGETASEGVCYMTGHDFTSNSGCAWMNPNGTITLIVHGNSSYTLRIRE
jgi:hypothetical protein